MLKPIDADTELNRDGGVKEVSNAAHYYHSAVLTTISLFAIASRV
jgi:hypothetical protein